jgi:hypothetical protein
MDEDEYGNSPFPKFQLKYPSGEVLTMQISQDEEGNGGGFIFLPYEPVMDDFDAEKAELGITV